MLFFVKVIEFEAFEVHLTYDALYLMGSTRLG